MRNWTLALTMIFLAVGVSAATLEEKIDRTFDVQPGGKVVLSNTNGHIKVTSWDQPRVRIQALKRIKGDSESVKEGMSKLRVDISQRNGDIIVDTKYPRDNGMGFIDFLFGDHIDANVEYDVTVPRTTNLNLDNVNGAIEVSDVAGDLKLETTNGRIAAERCAGSMDIETTNGGIEAELTRVTPGKTLSFETTNGRITLTLPKALAANIDAATTNGGIDSDIPIATQRVGRSYVQGSINGGGPALRMRTTNGGIQIKSLQ